MRWSMLAVRDVGEEDPLDVFPTPSGGKNSVLFTDLDGPSPTTVGVLAADLSLVTPSAARPEILLRLPKVDATLHVTDSRLVVASSGYQRTGRWVGGPTAFTLDRLGVVRASIRRSGGVLVGHVKYPWLQSIGYAVGRGRRPTQMIRINVAERSDGTEFLHRLDLTLSSSVSAETVAREVLQRAVRRRLSDPGLDADERSDLLALLDPPELTAARGHFSMWHAPSSLSPDGRADGRVDLESPLPTQPRSAEPVAPPTAVTLPPLPAAEVAGSPIERAVWWDETVDKEMQRGPSPVVPATPAAPDPAVPAWNQDPYERHELRYWDGATWTRHVSDHGSVSEDLPPGER